MHDQRFSPAKFKDLTTIWEQFFRYCFQAGPERCAFWFGSVGAIHQAYHEIEQRLRLKPYVVLPGDHFEWQKLDIFVFETFYDPMRLFPVLARVLARLRNKRGISAAEELDLSEPETNHLADPVLNISNGFESHELINCADRPDFSIGVQELEEYLESDEVTRYGRFTADAVLKNQGVCGRMCNLPRSSCRSDLG